VRFVGEEIVVCVFFSSEASRSFHYSTGSLSSASLGLPCTGTVHVLLSAFLNDTRPKPVLCNIDSGEWSWLIN
jgi:hypothetical protein